MVNPSISESAPTFLADTRARASRWTGQLGQLFGWLLVIEFGLMSVGLGLIVMEWPQTPAFLASAAGAWLLLLAGCRGLAALAQTPSRSGSAPRSAVRLTSPRSTPQRLASSLSSRSAAPLKARLAAPLKASAWTRSVNGQSPWVQAAERSSWTRPAREPIGSMPPAAVNGGGPASHASSTFSLASGVSGVSGVSGASGASAGSVVSAAPVVSVGKRVAIVEVASCAGTGFVLLQADWPGRPAAVPLALTFAGMAVIVCAALDVLVARFSTEGYPRQRLIRAGGWVVSAVLLMILIRGSAPVALGTAAILIGMVETGLGGWLLNRAGVERRARKAADQPSAGEPSAEDSEPRADADHGPLLGFLTDPDPDSDPAPDFWPWAVPSETA